MAAEAAVPKTVKLDATYLKRTARQPACSRKRGPRRPEGPIDKPQKGGVNTNLTLPFGSELPTFH